MGQGSDFDQVMDLIVTWGGSAERVAEIRDLATRAATSGHGLLAFLPPGLEPLVSAVNGKGHLTMGGVNALDALVADVNGQVGGAPFARLHLAMAPAVEISRRLMAAPRSEHLRQPLAQVTAGAFMVAARIAFEARDDDTSLRLYQEAVRAAVDAPAWQRTAMNTSRALVVLYSGRDVAAARAVADEAVRTAGRSESPIMRARAHALQAEMAARAGQSDHAFAALRLAWRDVDGDCTDDPAGGRFGAGHLDGFEGVCNVHLGRGAEAEPHLVDAMAALCAVKRLLIEWR
ncbi:hypothetical protein DP939_40920 [Spongiactinospora rosea]|uniref:Uncharacterized protein n=1 Tax=Spongiactinospora rosea TaxID=2248750 RepID=A0A366LKI4_9ACTN|nr:hypothetical protein DP939_40920 [Spongiactinospora rosea]